MKNAIVLITTILLFSAFSVQAQRKVTGTITGADDGMGLIGAAIKVKGTSTVAITDFDGNFSIAVPEGSNTLVITYVGMQTQEVDISNTDKVNAILKAEVTKIEEVIVAGVASATPKRKLSISVTKIDSKELEVVPATSAATALQGKVAGITVVNSSGAPGKSASIRLRGSTSVVGVQDPLIIVDGVMMEGELADINTDDIASFEVVKGAAASALYGSRAGNGVVVITTKRGGSVDEGKTEIRVRNEFGMQNLAKEISLATHHPYRLASDWNKQPYYTKYYGVTYPDGYTGGVNKDIKGTLSPDYDYMSDNPYARVIDHQKEFFRTGYYYTNYVSFANNSGKTKVFGSFENNSNSGIVEFKNGSKRQNFRINVDHQLSEKLKFSSSTLISENKMDVSDDMEGTGSPFSSILFMSPDVNLNMNSPDSVELTKYYAKADPWSNEENPKHAMYYNKINQVRNGVMQNISTNIKATSWAEFNIDYSIEKQTMDYSYFLPRGYQYDNERYIKGFIFKSNTRILSQNFQSVANLNGKFGDFITKAKFSYIYENKQFERFSTSGDDLFSKNITSLNNIRHPLNPSSYESETKAINYSAITDIDYKDRYILSILGRYDGSSLFGSEARWNPYYRISGAWIVSKDIAINGIDFLKLRLSQGTSGQRPEFYYQYETLSTSAGVLSKNTLGNKKLRPSETVETEFGVDVEFLNRFELHYSYAVNKTNGAFINVPQPAYSNDPTQNQFADGFRYKWTNAANLSSHSNEISFAAKIIDNSDIKWKANLSFDKIAQKYESLNAPPFHQGPESNGIPVFYVRAGENVGVMYGTKWLTSLDQIDISERNKYTVNSDGYVIVKGVEGTKFEKPIAMTDSKGSILSQKIADMNPKFNLSLNNMLSYKQLSFNMLWHLKYGGDIYNMTKQIAFREHRAGVQDQYGKPSNLKKAAPYYLEFYQQGAVNSYFVEDGTYLKLRELSVYYNLNRNKDKENSFIKEIKVGLLARNLLTLTKYTGWDPEVASGKDATNYAIDMFSTPNYRSYTISLELKF